MRLFIGITFDESTKSRLVAIQDRIKALSVKGSFTRIENLHLTLVFIGEVTSSLVPDIISIIQNTLLPLEQKAFSLPFIRIGNFKRSNKELWWIGPDMTDSETIVSIHTLTSIRQKIGDNLDRAGIHYDRRPFRAHITLGREIKTSGTIEQMEEKITVPVHRISLMKSERIKGLLTYIEIFAVDLKL